MHYSSPIIWAAALSWRLGTIHTSPEIFVPGVTEVCPKMLIRHVYGGPEHGPLHTLLLPLPGPLALYSIGLYFHHQSHPQLGVVFALAPSLQSFWSYSPLIAGSIVGTHRSGDFIFQCPIFLPFHTVSFETRILTWFAIPFSSGPHFLRTLHHDHVHLGWPYTTWFTLSLN